MMSQEENEGLIHEGGEHGGFVASHVVSASNRRNLNVICGNSTPQKSESITVISSKLYAYSTYYQVCMVSLSHSSVVKKMGNF